MPKRLEVRTHAKMCGGGNKDGDLITLPGGRAPELLQFRAKLSPPAVHVYERVTSYRAAGFEVFLYQYRGVRALE